jgi:hypothetical protein
MRLLIFIIGFTLSQATFAYGYINENSENVSMSDLVGYPNNYAGKQIRVIGIASFSLEGSRVCLSLEDVESSKTRNCIWLTFSMTALDVEFAKIAACDGETVLLEGVFIAQKPGHMGAYKAKIKWVNRYELFEKIDQRTTGASH